MVPLASAAVVTSACTGISGVDISGNITCPLFDPSLGSLTFVSIEIDAGISSLLLTVTNTNPSSITSEEGTATFDLQVNIGALPGFGQIVANPVASQLGPNVSVTVPPGDSFQFGPDPVVTTFGITQSSAFASILSSFVGPGIFDISASTPSNLQTTGSGFLSWELSGDVTADGSISYTYEPCVANCGDGGGTVPIPEPAALALLGLGLAGLGVSHRRKR
jgi:hypothetical protein